MYVKFVSHLLLGVLMYNTCSRMLLLVLDRIPLEFHVFSYRVNAKTSLIHNAYCCDWGSQLFCT